MFVVDLITEWIKGFIISGVMERFTNMFTRMNDSVADVAQQVGQSPEAWNSSIFSMIRALSDTAIVPIAGMILTFVLCYELIQLIIEKNNMAEFDVMNLYKWIFKTFVAVYILTNTFNIVMGVFALAQGVINSSAGVIGGSLSVGAGDIAAMQSQLEAMGIGELIGLWLEITVVDLCMGIMSICVFVVTFGRMLEIYLVSSIAPIPLSTMANREWGQIGNNYLKSLFALAFQGFLIMVCIAVYAILVQGIPSAANPHAAIWTAAGYSVLLCFSLFKTGSLSKSLFQAH